MPHPSATRESRILRLAGISKSFGPVRALDGVDMSVAAGEVHALIGENGAGKSTLMKILAGAHAADAGEMFLDGAPYHPAGPRDGRDAGVSMIYQELMLAPHLSVLENVALGLETSRRGWIIPRRAEVRQALDGLGQHDIELDTRVGDLSIGKQQVVEIARALLANARIVVMDEPTSSLSASDAAALFDVIRRLRDNGIAVVYISHFLEEVLEIADRYTVLRDGKTVATGNVRDITINDLIPPMIGRAVDELYPTHAGDFGEVLLAAQDLTGAGDVPSRAGLTVRRGEIVGIGGLVGAGRSELLRTLFGLHPGADGSVTIHSSTTRSGQDSQIKVTEMSPRRALDAGLNLLSEDRKSEGLATGLPVRVNLTLSRLGRYVRGGRIRLGREHDAAASWVEKLRIRCASVEQRVATLSGGNQQKVCLARLLHDDSDVLLLDEPTRGVDIGSKAEIYRLVVEAAESGKGVVVTSSYLPELFGLCDTIAIMHRGRLSSPRPTAEWTEEDVLLFATTGEAG